MAKGKLARCPKCAYLNDEGVLFCHQCGAQVEHYAMKDIERMSHQAQCPKCDYYNPVGSDTCAKCGCYLKSSRSVLVRDQDGRATLLRETQLDPTVKRLAWTCFFMILLALAAVTIATADDSGGVGNFLGGFRGRMTLCCWLATVLFLGGEWQTSGILYRVKTALVMLLLLLTALMQAGPPLLDVAGVKEGQIQLAAVLGVTMYGELYIVRGGTPPGVLSTGMAFVGLYGSVSPIMTLFAGGGLLESVTQNRNLVRDLPDFLGPTFVLFHLFLPYCFFAMAFGALRAYERAMERVSGTVTLMRFLNRRKQEARGEVLNLFIVGAAIYMGFAVMSRAGVQNVVTFAATLIDKYM